MVGSERLIVGLTRRAQIAHSYSAIGKLNLAFYASFPLKDWEIVDMYEKLGKLIAPGMLALDLGSAKGKLITALSIVGATAKGIDASQFLVNSSNAIAEQMTSEGFIGPDSCVAYTGNYFPPDFETPDDVKWDSWLDGESSLTSDPYLQMMGLNLDDFDLLTVYQYEKNRKETLRLLGERCKVGATVVVWSSKPRDIPGNFTILRDEGQLKAFKINS